jgi:hypothetical protein
MTAGKNRVRLAVEQMEDRCTPSVLGAGLTVPFPTPQGGLHAEAARRVGATNRHPIPIKVAFRCSVDFSSLTVSTTGVGTGLGRWTALGNIIGKPILDTVADLGVYSGTGTLVTAKGDQVFYSFTTSWQLSTGKGTHFLLATGGTGRFAGASGRGSVDCTLTPDPASPTVYRCKSAGSGTLILALR